MGRDSLPEIKVKGTGRTMAENRSIARARELSRNGNILEVVSKVPSGSRE